MSKLRSSLAAYTDVRKAFNIAVERGSLVVELNSIGAAINFKQRANRFRNLERERIAEQNAGMPGFAAETVYDTFEIVFFPPLNEKKQSRAVYFRPRELGRIIDPETGEEIKE